MIHFPPFAEFVVRQILSAARQRQALGEVLPKLGVGSASIIRDRFRRHGLPSPRKWRRLAEATYALLRLQRSSGSLFTHAIELGYSECSSLSHQLSAVFGAPPGAVRKTIGWEWWVDTWVRSRKAHGEFACRC